MKKLFLLSSLILVISSGCTEDQPLISTPASTEIKLKTSTSLVEPFRNVKVSIDIDLDAMLTTYDSIKWKCNGVAYRMTANEWYLEDDERDLRVTDYRPGTHMVHAFGYKDGKVISKDSITYKMTYPTGDFFGIEWNKNQQSSDFYFTTGLPDLHYLPTSEISVKYGGMVMSLIHFVEYEDHEYISLRTMPWFVTSTPKTIHPFVRTNNMIPDITEFDWTKDYETWESDRGNFERYFFITYLTEFYGEPHYKFEGPEASQTTLSEVYKTYFAEGFLEERYNPIAIWTLPKTNICILQTYNSIGDTRFPGICKVIAVPAK